MAQLEAAIATLGDKLWQRMQGEVPGLFNADFWQGKLLDWAMRDPGFRIDLFRFVDVLPALRDRKQVFAHLKDYLLREERPLPPVLSATLKAASGGLTGVVAVEVIKRNLIKMAENFIVGETPEAALPVLRKLDAQGIAFTADLLGEATLTPGEAEDALERYTHLIDTLAQKTADWSRRGEAAQRLRHSQWGPMPLANVSIKLSALDGRLDPVNAEASASRLAAKLKPLFLKARAHDIAVNLDLETWALHGIVYDVFATLARDPQLRDWPYMGVVVQAYLHEAPRDVARLLALAQERGAPLSVRLVKGAYWDYENALAQQRGQACPVLVGKEAVDAQYEALSRTLLDHTDRVMPAFGSHNLRSLVHAVAYAESRGITARAYEVQMLYGMAEPERAALRDHGLRVRVYAPVGALLPGMAYLVRRLLENTSNTGFLRQTYHEHTDVGQLLAPPRPRVPHGGHGADPGSLGRPATGAQAGTPGLAHGANAGLAPGATQGLAPTPLSATPPSIPPFANAPLLDFSNDEVRAHFAAAVVAARQAPPRDVPAVLEGKPLLRPGDHTWTSPNDGRSTVTRSTWASPEEAARAVESAHRAFPAWDALGPQARAAFLLRLAARLEADRMALAALQVVEVAKPWSEADADVAEAIDFGRYYAARAAAELGEEALISPAGEANTLSHQGRGVCVVIAPWNFPLAILTGMATAALVAGNTVVLKPAEQSEASGYALYQALRLGLAEAGYPLEAVQFVPGRGEVVGPILTRHPLVAQVAFTGSQAVGTQIAQATAGLVAGQRQLKRLVCELGGKNAILVDDDADLDEAVAGVARSAFGFAGQKCSAASRLFVVGDLYASFIARLTEHLQLWSVRPATDPACDVPPVIDDEALMRLRRVLADPGQGARLLAQGSLPEGPGLTGHFIPPTLFEVDSPNHPLMQVELFGPVLAVLKASSFDQALAWVEATPYALTGAVYSRRPSHIAKARQAFRVGNLYINRPCTGAVVGRQPFGGFGHSGFGTKAGGPGYLRLFADPRVISENTMRHGFSPDMG